MLPKGKFKSIVARRVKPETVDQQGPGIPESKLNSHPKIVFYLAKKRDLGTGSANSNE